VDVVQERHRHRLEINNKYRPQLERAGMIMCGVSPDNLLVEMIELKDHPWFVATQFHPEFQSRPHRVHPLFRDFIKASMEYRKRMEELSPRARDKTNIPAEIKVKD
jgi:CTP synthase